MELLTHALVLQSTMVMYLVIGGASLLVGTGIAFFLMTTRVSFLSCMSIKLNVMPAFNSTLGCILLNVSLCSTLMLLSAKHFVACLLQQIPCVVLLTHDADTQQ